MMTIPKLNVNDILELKKTHPCGDRRVKILRLGTDVKIECLGCGHNITINRLKLEKAIRKILPALETKGNVNE